MSNIKILTNPYIVVAEDEESIRTMMPKLLKFCGLNITEPICPDARSARAKLEELAAKPDIKERGLLLITDYNMPGGDADTLYEFLDSWIKDKPSRAESIRILGSTANYDASVHTTSLTKYSNLNSVLKAFTTKPFEIRKLKELITNLLNGQALAQ